MPVRISPAARGAGRGRAIVADLCRELETARVAAGLSYATLGRHVGLSGAQVRRICRGESPSVSIERLASLLATVGLDLSARAYPGGTPVRDAAHLALLRRLQARLHPSLGVRLEVPVTAHAPGIAPDHRAWDAVIDGSGWHAAVELETRLADVQAIERRLNLKARDGEVAVVLLVVNDTAHNRRVLASRDVTIRQAWPGSPRLTLGRLAHGQQVTTSAVIVL